MIFTLQCLLNTVKMFLVLLSLLLKNGILNLEHRYTKSLLGLCAVAGSLLAR